MTLGLGRKGPALSERQQQIELLRQTQVDLEAARVRFNMATQPELIEQCVYEINALQARYAYFLRVIRETYTSEGVAT